MTAPTIQNLTLNFTSTANAVEPVGIFDGSASLTGTPGNIPASAMTLEFWICTEQASDPAAAIVSCGSGADALTISNPAALVVSMGGTNQPATSVSVADGAWHQVSVTVAPFTSTTLAVQIFVDGALAWTARALTQRSADAWPPAGASLTLGTGFIGQLSEFRIWSGVQSASAIATDMAIRVPAGTDGPVLEWPLSDTPAGATEAGVTYATPSPTLQFLDTRTLEASWTSAGSGITYAVAVEGGCVCIAPETVAESTYPITNFSIGISYTVTVAAISGNEVGTPSSASVATIDLGVPALQQENPLPPGSYSIDWPSVDQAASYHVTMTTTPSGGTATTTVSDQTGTSLDLTTEAFGTGSTSYSLASTATGITGPYTAVPAIPAAPGVSLIYDQPSAPPGTLSVTLSNTDAAIPYLINLTPAADATGTATPTQIVPVGAGCVDLGSYTPDNSNPVTLSITGQGVPLGAIGAAGSGTVTLWNLAAPTITSLSANTGASTVTAAFTYAGTSPAGLQFYATLTYQDTPGTILADTTVSASPAVFTSAYVTEDAALAVQIRALADNSQGTWSPYSDIDIVTPAKVNITAASFNSGMDATVSWNAVSGSGITYVACLYDAGTLVYTAPATANTTITMNQSQTGATSSGSCTTTVTATSGAGVMGPTSDAATVTQTPAKKKTEHTGDPVDVSTGSNTYIGTDMEVVAVVPLVLSTYYSGAWPTPSENALIPASPLGNRWSHTYMTQLVIDGSTVYLIWGYLSLEVFQLSSSGTGYLIPAGSKPGTTVYLASNGSYTVALADASSYVFNASGQMTDIIDRNGNTATLAYVNGKLDTVTDTATGRTLTFAYSGTMLQSVTDPMGSTVQYGQNGSNLETITNAVGAVRQFAYTGASLMQSAVDGNGNTVFQNTYNSDNQITKQLDAQALATGATYSFDFGYQTQTSGGISQLLTTGTDAEGNAFTYVTDTTAGAVVQIQKDLGGGRVQNIYRSFDGLNNMISETVYVGPSAGYVAGTGNQTSYTYDGNANVLTEVTQLTSSTVYAISRDFDAASNMLYEAVYEGAATGFTQGAGNKWVYTYNPDNTLDTVTDPLGGVTRFAYGDYAQVSEVTDPYGNVTSYGYTDGDLTSVTDPTGTTVNIGCDAIGRPTSIATVAGGVTLSEVGLDYDAVSQVTERSVMLAGQSAAQAFVTRYDYDLNGNRTSITDATGTLTQYDYNANNYMSQVGYAAFGGVSRSIQYAYDNLNFPQSQVMTSDASGAVAVTVDISCDALGQPLSMTDPNSNIYDFAIGMVPGAAGPFNQSQVTTWPLLDGDATVYTDQALADAIGRPLSSTGRAGNTVSIAYTTLTDSATGTIQSVETRTFPATATQAQTSIVTVRDALGRIVSYTDQAGKETTVAYGSTPGTGGVVWTSMSITDPNGIVRIQARDPKGRLMSDSLGDATLQRVHTYAYDGLGRLVSATTTQGTSTTATNYSYGFDTTTGTMTKTTGRPGETTGATVDYYNGLNQLVSSLPPYANAALAYSYTPWGGLAGFTNGSGQTLSYSFDDAFRLVQTTIPGADPIVYELDDNGERKTVTQGSETVERTFDTWGRMLTRTGAVGSPVTYTYWPEDQVETLTYPSGVLVSYGIDALGRMTSVSDWTQPTAQVVTYSYTLTNRIAAIDYPNGAVATYAYDDGNRLTELDISSGGLILAQWQAQYDALNQLSQVVSIDPIAPTMPSGDTSITYLESNEIETINGSAAAYDADGAYIGSSATSPDIAYDAFGRVVSASLPSLPSVSYGYDPDGLQVSVASGSDTSSFVYDIGGYQSPAVERGDPWRALVDDRPGASNTGGTSTLPVYADGSAPDMTAALDRLLEIYGADSSLEGRFLYGHGLLGEMDAAGDMAWFHPDPIGNLWAQTNSAGTLAGAAVYGPFGAPYGQFGAAASLFGYGGYYGVTTDGSGLIGMRARSYMASQMRFLQPDYLTGTPYLPQSLNRYAFVEGNPLQYTDPLGLFSFSHSFNKAVNSIASGIKKFGESTAGIVTLGVVGSLGFIGVGLYMFYPMTPSYQRLPTGDPDLGDGGGNGGNNGGNGGNGGGAPGDGDIELEPLLQNMEPQPGQRVFETYPQSNPIFARLAWYVRMAPRILINLMPPIL